VNYHPLFVRLPNGKTLLDASQINTGRTDNPLYPQIRRAFLAATLPKDAKRISSVGNGPIVTRDSEANQGETTTFYDSASFAKTVTKRSSCAGIRPGIFMVFTEGDKGSGPSGVQVFSEYLARCYTLTL
jgi:hypothetical protein